ncbi:hypothetical protein ACSLBF_14600 [Pseudoalteromonas sp. T1lg65]|uniref:hypothetical protein n=1 Tax=Pseudoalteromonas sp. T1lg65 TaxID=2077101 RepID=UPI003F790AD4
MAQQQQDTIWYDAKARLAFAELVNAFYARELPELAKLADHARLQRLLTSLPYYVERAATHIVRGDVPLELDSNNGCWLAKQRAEPNVDKAANQAFFSTHSDVGLVVPVMVSDQRGCGLQLDSIDQIRADQGVHCNQFGWFNFSGDSITVNAQTDADGLQLLKPSKVFMVAACCGHRWQFGKAMPPRRLTLREMLLASGINWRQVQKRKKQNK